METSIVISGFGGQGVLFAGQLLAYAGMDAGLHVTWIPSYGPEMRGGTAHCTVIVGDEPIGAPVVAQPDVAIVLNLPSYDKYEPLVKPGGVLVVNSSLVTAVSERDDVTVIAVPANALSEEVGGSPKMVNVVAVGAMLACVEVLTLPMVVEALRGHLPKSKAHLLEANFAVLQAGHDAAVAQLVVS